MPRTKFSVDSSDKTVEKSKEYVKDYLFISWLTGRPEFISGYSITTKNEREILWFRDKKEIRKFAKFLLKVITPIEEKTSVKKWKREQVIEERKAQERYKKERQGR